MNQQMILTYQHVHHIYLLVSHEIKRSRKKQIFNRFKTEDAKYRIKVFETKKAAKACIYKNIQLFVNHVAYFIFFTSKNGGNKICQSFSRADQLNVKLLEHSLSIFLELTSVRTKLYAAACSV